MKEFHPLDNPHHHQQQLDNSRSSTDSLLSSSSISTATLSPPSHQHHQESNLSFFVIVAFTVNYVMGTGFLTIPWAFHRCGVLLGILVLFVMIGPSIMSILLILQTITRADVFLTMSNRLAHQSLELSTFHSQVENPISVHRDMEEVIDDEDENKEKEFPQNLHEQHNQHEHIGMIRAIEEDRETNPYFKISQKRSCFQFPSASFTSTTASSLPFVGNIKYETTQLCELFLGHFGKQCYTLSIAIFLYGTLWAYSTVFAHAIITHINPFGSYSYHFFLFIFSLIVIPLSCRELTEQLYLQVILSCCRILMIFCMIGTILYAIYLQEDLFQLQDHTTTSSSPPLSFTSLLSRNNNNLIQWQGLSIILPIAVYSNMFHHSIPSLSEPAANKRQLGYMFATALLCCFFSYTLIGIIVSLYFDDAILSSSNLNWEHFGQSHSHSTLIGFLERLIASFVIIFPALDVASAFPLNAITLGNNLYTSFHENEENKKAFDDRDSGLDNDNASGDQDDDDGDGGDISSPTLSNDDKKKKNERIRDKNKSNKILIGYRLLAAVPPLVFAIFISDLGIITDYTGITGMFVVFIFPGLLSLASERLLRRHDLPTKTYYSNIFTSRKAAIFLIVFGGSMICYTLLSLIFLE